MLPAEISGDVENFIRKMLESDFMEEAQNESHTSLPDMLTECPACHYTLEEYEESGTLGCPQCYATFAPELNEIMGDDKDAASRAGVIEQELLSAPALELGRLEVLLQDAIKSENFEEAAKLRDRIRSLSNH